MVDHNSILEIVLISGRRLYLEQLYIWRCGPGLKVKWPRSHNEFTILSHEGAVLKLWPGTRSVLLNEQFWVNQVEQPFPSLAFLGRFSSYEHVSEKVKNPTHLGVMWLQEEINPVISAENMTAFKRLNWEQQFEGASQQTQSPLKQFFKWFK